MKQTEFNLAELDRILEGIAGAMDERLSELHGLSREYAEVLLRKMSVEAMEGRMAA